MNKSLELSKQQEEILARTEDYVQDILKNDSSGHDWWHIQRVVANSISIAQMENANIYICILAALLHDVIDDKIVVNEKKAIECVRNFLEEEQVASIEIEQVLDIITSLSYKGGAQQKSLSLEGQIVQDADRLDAIGAIGIARVMCYSGSTGRLIHDPSLTPRINMSLEEYRHGKSTAIMHFYEKLLKLKDLMNTSYGKKMAAGRHKYLEQYLKQFYAEWEGTK